MVEIMQLLPTPFMFLQQKQRIPEPLPLTNYLSQIPPSTHTKKQTKTSRESPVEWVHGRNAVTSFFFPPGSIYKQSS